MIHILNEGKNTIQWNISDHCGNNYYFIHIIQIDLTAITFHDFVPVEWQNCTNINVGISLTDINGSGVNGETIQYSYSTTDIYSFSSWIPIYHNENEESVTISFEFNGTEGRNNTLRFKAFDLAGNVAISSRIYSVCIDTKSPEITILSPLMNTTINPYNLVINISIVEETSGINEIISVIVNSSHSEIIELNYSLTWVGVSSCRIEYYIGNFSFKHFSYQIKCIDNAMNIGKTVPISIRINQPPIIRILTPTNESVHFFGDPINFNSSIIDIDNDNVSITWYLDDLIINRDIRTFSIMNISVGNHKIRIVVSDDYYLIEDVVSFNVNESSKSTLPGSLVFIILIFVFVLAMCSLYLIIKRRRKN
jgi:hypothetical protein